ncbi:DUF4381 domain-containing protein [Alteromonas lipolytica]|uniref:DUF4381 domain-containing protein n=1 Tax=Alteromonas lipolytica TaxID=1856405 RepID=A0A1E8FKM4_9ALTE|nr:DUF4381 domain-containing protein [Alteromonas lipolytica]OFI35993.1 hypothetical protein BFC17_09960 [Alteromonas lipolytica]GGF71851.1 hypothetical protein GCM10011338_25110 [Alteromonas lipolytica]
MDPLAQLKDIQTPQGVDWWPLAWGWWALALVAIVLIGFIVFSIVSSVRFNRPRRQAVKLHKSLVIDAHYPAQANQLIKRVTLHYFSPDKSASAYGDSWQRLLQSCLKPNQHAKVAAGLTLLTQHSYQPTPLSAPELQQIHDAVSYWLQHARLKQVPQTAPRGEVTDHV